MPPPRSQAGTELQVGTVIGGRYVIVRTLGAGGMGAVFEVTDPDGQRFAVKLLHHSVIQLGGMQSVTRFVREARVSTTIRSKHIVPVVDGGVDESLNAPFLVMELLDGTDLEECLWRVKALHPAVAARIMLQACKGLDAAHSMGVIHRDIKPANLFLHDDGAGHITVKVCDFGVAKAFLLSESLTQSGATLGTPLYMAPEQLMNAKRVDHRADIWSIGITLFEALSGSSPFAHVKSLSELALTITGKPVPHVQDFAPWIEPDLAAIVHGTLLVDIDDRCPSIRELMDALEVHAAGTDEIDQTMLGPLPAEFRALQTRRADLSPSWEAVAVTLAPPPPKQLEQDPLVGTWINSRYHLTRVVGQGGMGTVYEASSADGYPCAVKVLRDDRNAPTHSDLRRFVREVRTSMSITSENVVKVMDADTDPERNLPYLVMELLHGTDLDHHLKRVGPLEPATTARLFVQAAEGIAAAHEKGIIHRDIKPANIFLHTPSGNDVVVKICDFGVAKKTYLSEADQSATELTRTGGMLGSPLYMSPEQAQSAKSVDLRTDIWSLALSMYQALSGQKPWPDCETPGQLILAICTRDVASLEEIAPWLPKGLVNAVHKGLARDPRARYASMEEFTQAIRPFAGNSTEVTSEKLVAVSPERRAMVVPAHVGAATASNMATTKASEPARRRWVTALGVGAGILVVGAGLVFFGVRTWDSWDAAPPAESRTPASVVPDYQPLSVSVPSLGSTKTTYQLVVPVDPPEARVVIDGTPRKVVDGGVQLEGHAGERFVFVAEHRGATQEGTVEIGTDGAPNPSTISVAPKTPTVRTPKHSEVAAKPEKPKADVTNKGKPTTKEPAQPPTAQPIASKPPSRESW